MKLTDAKPCANCGQPLLGKPGIGTFYVVRTTAAMINQQAAREVMGLNTMFNGSMQLAEIMAPRADEAIMVFGDKDKSLMTEMYLCFDCFNLKDVSLGQLAEKHREDTAVAHEADERAAALSRDDRFGTEAQHD